MGPKDISADPNTWFFTGRSYSSFSTDRSLTASRGRTPKNSPRIFRRWFKLLTLLNSSSWVLKTFAQTQIHGFLPAAVIHNLVQTVT